MIPPSFPASTNSAHELAHPHFKKRKTLIAIIFALIAILGGGAAAYAAMQGWITLPFNLLAPKPPTIQDIAKAIAKISSGDATVSIRYATQAKQADTVIIPAYPSSATSTDDLDVVSVVKTTAKQEFAKYFMDAKINLETKASFDVDNNEDGQGNVQITYQNSGMTLAFDSDYAFINKSFFLKLNAFPLPFLDFSSLSNKWIRFPEQGLDATSILLGSSPDRELSVWESDTSSTTSSSTSELAEKKLKTRQKELILFRNKLVESQAIVIDSAELLKKSNLGNPIWVLRVHLIPEKLFEAIEATIDDQTDPMEHELFTESLKQEIRRDEVKEWIKTLLSSMWSELSVQANTFEPIHQSFHFRFATDASQAVETPKEFLVDTSYTLEHINSPISITEPKDSITLTKAIQILTGKSDEEVVFHQQASLVGDLKQALQSYRQEHEQYPDSLQQLIGQAKYTKAYLDDLSQYSSSTAILSLQKHVARIPSDLYTKSPFIYSPSADKQSYTLTYQIRIPEGLKGSFIANNFIEGTNTATPTQDSVEADTVLDSDSDGLTDTEERARGTSIYIKDTDGDGYTDKQEVDGGFDPLTKAKK